MNHEKSMSYSKRFIKYSKSFYALLNFILSDSRVESEFILSNYFASNDQVWICCCRSSGATDVAMPGGMDESLESF